MNRKARPLILLAAIAMLVACAPRQPQTTESLTTATAVVRSVDHKTREVSLRDSANGAEFSVVAGPEVRNLPQVEAGDTVRLDFYQATTLAMAAPARRRRPRARWPAPARPWARSRAHWR